MLLDTSKWPQITLDILTEIRLDPKNVRLEMADAQVEADIIEDLFVNEGALSLVEGICRVGYLTHETPVVLKRQGEYVMVEGNRRLAALKAMQNPMLIPEYRARVSALTALLPDRSSLSRVRVMIAPSQTEADQLIAAIHTGNLRRPWTPARQSAFFQAQIDAGRAYSDLLVRYPTIDVRKFVLRARVLNLFKSVAFDDPKLEDFLLSKEWTTGLSTLARIYESKDFIALTGLAMDADGVLTKQVSADTFKQMATVIVQGMLDKSINTRSLNSVKSPRFTQLIGELRAIQQENDGASSSTGDSLRPASPNPRSTDFDASQDDVEPDQKAATSSTSGDRGRKSSSPKPGGQGRKKKQKWLDLSYAAAPTDYPVALRCHLAELSAMDVQRFPNATFVMLRAILEKSIKSFAEAKNEDIRQSGNNQNGRVQLRHTLDWLLNYVKANGPNHLIQPIERMRTGRLVIYTNTQDALNAINHNHHFMVDPDEVIAMWDSMDPIMRYLMKP